MTRRVVVAVLIFCAARSAVAQQNILGAWAFQLPDLHPVWLKVDRVDGHLSVEFLWSVGNARPIREAKIVDGELTFLRRTNWKSLGKPNLSRSMTEFRARATGDEMQLRFRRVADEQNAASEWKSLKGHRIPPPPGKPDLAKVKFAEPVELFNGKDLSGWVLSDVTQKNGWDVRQGVLVNETPKTDFGGYGTFGNLMTERLFTDFELSLEYNVPKGGNSGVYLRGMYEAQVVDRDSRMQGISGPGAIFGRIPPAVNAGRVGGEWNTYVLTLVDRHVTVVLNGHTVIDNQLLAGCTGGGINANDSQPGPIFLQGDHTSVSYRNIRLRPVIDSETP